MRASKTRDPKMRLYQSHFHVFLASMFYLQYELDDISLHDQNTIAKPIGQILAGHSPTSFASDVAVVLKQLYNLQDVINSLGCIKSQPDPRSDLMAILTKG